MSQASTVTLEGEPIRRSMTYEEFLEDPSIDAHSEWVSGEVVRMMSVSREHTQVTGFLLRLMSSYVEHHDRGEVLFDPFSMKIADSGRAPDICFLANAHVDRLRTNHIEGPADIAVEVISPGTGGIDRGEKFFEYEAGGVLEYWLIDPLRRTAEFYALSERGVYEVMAIQDGMFRSGVLDGFWLKVEWLWERPRLAAVETELGLR